MSELAWVIAALTVWFIVIGAAFRFIGKKTALATRPLKSKGEGYAGFYRSNLRLWQQRSHDPPRDGDEPNEKPEPKPGQVRSTTSSDQRPRGTVDS